MLLDSVTALQGSCWWRGYGVLTRSPAMASMPLLQTLHVLQRHGAGGTAQSAQWVSQALKVWRTSLMGRNRARGSLPAMALMPLP